MERFRYQAYNKEGLRIEGALESPDLDLAKANLKAQGLILVRMERETGEKSLSQRLRLEKKVTFSDLEFFSSEIAILLKNGVKVDRALGIIQSSVKQESLKRLVETLYGEVRKGVPLSEALRQRGQVFDPLYVTVVAIGEKTGMLAEAFSDVEKTMKFRKQIASRIKQAIAYPAFVLFFCVLVLIFVFNFIIPRFSVMFDAKTDIPFYTQLLLGFSSFFRTYQFIIYPVMAILPFLIIKGMNKPAAKKGIDFCSCRLPGLRTLVLTLENLRFASALKILLKNKVVIDDALGYAVDAVGNCYLRARIRNLQEDIKRGHNLSETLGKTHFFPASLISLVEVGEHSGNLEEIFQELEERLRTKFEEGVMQLTTFIEPVLILGMGLIVGGIVIVMLLSIISFQDIRM